MFGRCRKQEPPAGFYAGRGFIKSVNGPLRRVAYDYPYNKHNGQGASNIHLRKIRLAISQR